MAKARYYPCVVAAAAAAAVEVPAEVVCQRDASIVGSELPVEPPHRRCTRI
jgi:hypothetical protein